MSSDSGDKDYLVLARKYRPQKFGELVGQEHVVDTLKNAGYNPNSIVLLPQWNDLAGH